MSGIELQQNYVDALNKEGIFANSLDAIKNDTLDVILSFHVIEHLHNPLEILSKFMDKIVSGGHIILKFLMQMIFYHLFWNVKNTNNTNCGVSI